MSVNSMNAVRRNKRLFMPIGLSALLITALICSGGARLLAVGWVLLFGGGIFFTIGLLALHSIAHVIVLLRSRNIRSSLIAFIVISHAFLFLSLSTQWDAFDGPAHNGLSILLSKIHIELSREI